MVPSKVLVTGGAGFIASHLQQSLLNLDIEVISVDIQPESVPSISELIKNQNFHYFQRDVNDTDTIIRLCEDADIIYHMASNTNIRTGLSGPESDITDTLGSTISLLEAMRRTDVRSIFFPSSSAVYGRKGTLLSEETGDLRPISYYGACKLASEALISSYSQMNDLDALVFRLPNIIGPGMTHGVVYDFVKKLSSDPDRLQILGNGKQKKQYLHVSDLVDGIIDFTFRMDRGYDCYNISNDSSIDVVSIADIVCKEMGLHPTYQFTGGESGWKGDVPYFDLDSSKAGSRGWTYRYDSESAIIDTLRSSLR